MQGLFLIVSVMVAYFEKHFTEAHDKDDEYFKAQRDIRRRVGLMMAFFLLQSVHKNHRSKSKIRLSKKASRSLTSAMEAAAANRQLETQPHVVSRQLLQEFLEVRCSLTPPLRSVCVLAQSFQHAPPPSHPRHSHSFSLFCLLVSLLVPFAPSLLVVRPLQLCWWRGRDDGIRLAARSERASRV